jgi:xylulokinase
VKYLLGYDIGSSSVKAALLDGETGRPLAVAFSPADEMPISAPSPGFAEQDPERWWQELIHATAKLKTKHPFAADEICSIGISYQMHGLVCIDRDFRVLRPSIIWCDSRAVETGSKAFDDLGRHFCLQHFLNSPGNFTASKLKWVKDHEPGIYEKIYRILLPGDYIALRLTGMAVTTRSGLSEGIFWDYPAQDIAHSLLSYYGIDPQLLAPLTETFGEQGRVTAAASAILGIKTGTPVSYRAGDQPNNAFSLQVMHPGEIAATAGTSGVVYGITDRPAYDAASRVNPFIHVNHQSHQQRYGILMCLNGTGILNSWLRRNFFSSLDYDQVNAGAATAGIGSEGILCYPFGNGAERILENKNPGAQIRGLDFNRHQWQHLARAAQEGIVFALYYGTRIMQPMGVELSSIKAGSANMFLSNVFASSFANITNCSVALYNTDGSTGAARGAGLGSGYFKNSEEAFRGMEVVKVIDPEPRQREQSTEAYENWKTGLDQLIQ